MVWDFATGLANRRAALTAVVAPPGGPVLAIGYDRPEGRVANTPLCFQHVGRAWTPVPMSPASMGASTVLRNATLADDGTWMIVEPMAGDRVEDNLNPVGRAYYGFSTLLCTPASLSQEVGLALGAQAGEARIRDVVTSGGFTRFRRAAETPFNLVFEARP